MIPGVDVHEPTPRKQRDARPFYDPPGMGASVVLFAVVVSLACLLAGMIMVFAGVA